MDHILVQCVFARQVWHKCFQQARLDISLVPTTNDSLEDWWMASRALIPAEHRKGFDSLVMLFTWQLWKHRNDMVFGQRTAIDTVQHFTMQTFEIMRTWALAGGRGVSIFCE